MRRGGLALALSALAASAGVGLAPPSPTGAQEAGGPGVTYLCGKSSGYDCMPGTGYRGQSVWGSHGPGHNCVSYAAHRLQQNGSDRPWAGPLGNGSAWDENARAAGYRVDGVPAVGAIAQWDGGSGHVAYVEEVTPTHIVITEDAYAGFSAMRRIERSSPTFAEAEFIHIRDVDTGADDILLHGQGTAPDAMWWGGRASRTPMPGDITLDGLYEIAAGDFDGDGVGDLLLDARGASRDHMLWGVAGEHRFTYEPLDLLSLATERVSAAGDLDGDGADDIVFLGEGGAPDEIWWGTPGERRFTIEPRTIALPYRPAIGDLDGDGAADIVLLGQGDTPDRILWGIAGERRFDSQPAAISDEGAPAIGDLDGDGADDLVVHGTAASAVWWGHPGGRLLQRASLLLSGAAAVAVGDVDADGADDLVVVGEERAGDAIWWGERGARRLRLTPIELGPGRPLVADLDGR